MRKLIAAGAAGALLALAAALPGRDDARPVVLSSATSGDAAASGAAPGGEVRAAAAAPPVRPLARPAAPGALGSRDDPAGRVEPLPLDCRPVGSEGGGPAAACAWSRPRHPDAAAYRLWRGERRAGSEQRTVVHRTSDLQQTKHVDSGVEAGRTYLYVVEALAGDGRVVARGGPARVETGAERRGLHLACQPAEDQRPAIACRWSRSASPGFAAYRLWRSAGSDPAVVSRTGDRSETGHVDRSVEPGRRYVYRVEAVDADGAVLEASPPAAAVAGGRPSRPAPLHLACQASGPVLPGADGPGGDRSVACRWSGGPAGTAGYRLLRRGPDREGTGEPVVVCRVPAGGRTGCVDGTVRAGRSYAYAVEAVDGDGRVVASGGPVKVAVPA